MNFCWNSEQVIMLQTDELLLRLTTSDNMDFCEDLTNIQSTLNYVNEYIKPLNKIRFRGGKLCCPFNEKFYHTYTIDLISINQQEMSLSLRTL